MASKADLIRAANAIAAKLGKSVDTSGKTNAQLQTLVSELRAEADAVISGSISSNDTAGLVAEAKGLADELGTEVATDNLSDDELSELIGNLKVGVDEKAKADANEAGVEAAAEAKEKSDAVASQKVKDVANEKKPPFYIADGRSLVCLPGVLGPGDEIKPTDLPGGREALMLHVKTGLVCEG